MSHGTDETKREYKIELLFDVFVVAFGLFFDDDEGVLNFNITHLSLFSSAECVLCYVVYMFVNRILRSKWEKGY
jgi:hypothetical protein